MIPRFKPSFSITDAFPFNKPQTLESAEEAFKKGFGYSTAVWFPYARVAVKAFLETVKNEKKLAILSPFNCVALGNAIASAKHTLHFVDTEPDGFNQDLGKFIDAVRKTKGVAIPVALWGIGYPHDQFQHINTPILHDYALRILSKERPFLKEMDGVVYSLNWGKPITGFKGAFLCGDNPEQEISWKNWRRINFLNKTTQWDAYNILSLKIAFSNLLFPLALKIHENTFLTSALSGKPTVQGKLLPDDWNFYPSNIIIAKTLKSLKSWSVLSVARGKQVEFYDRSLHRLSGTDFILPKPEALSHYPIRTKHKKELVRFLWKRGVFVSSNLFDRLLSDCTWLNIDAPESQSFSNARNLIDTTVHLPLYDALTETQQEKIINLLYQFNEQAILPQTP